jgi:CRISPR-associated protein Cmr1
MSTIIDARYQVVTPLFCAGVDQDRPELRLPSFKGVLRFWWRALAWSRCQGDLRVIQREEDALFGSNAGGQSRVSMRLVPDFEPRTIGRGQVLRVPGTQLPVGEGARYLGYGGRGTAAGQLTRACLCAPLDFTVRMRGRNLNESQLQSLQKALFALGTLGSMGSKSRKGYGSLSLQSLSVDEEDEWSAPEPWAAWDPRAARDTAH